MGAAGSAADPRAGPAHAAQHGKVVGFGAAPSKEHGGRLRAQRVGDRGPGVLEPGPGATAPAVSARRIPEVVRQTPGHDPGDFGAHGSSGGVIEVDRVSDAVHGSFWLGLLCNMIGPRRVGA